MKIRNVDRLKRKLARMSRATKEEIRTALAQSAGEIAELMRRTVPVADGDLRDSIIWQYGDQEKVSYSQTLGSVTAGHELSVRISAGNSKVRYAHLVEFGTAAHVAGGKFAGAQHPGTTAQPFFYPSYRLGKKRAKARINRATTRAAKKVAAGR